MIKVSQLLFLTLAAAVVQAGDLATYNVVWDTPGVDSRDSMPLGNGDIGLNVWTEPNGDVMFYISKTDAWAHPIEKEKGLLKIGRVRIKLSESEPLVHQTLQLREGAVEIQTGSRLTRIWVDANRPVVRVETTGTETFTMQARFESLRPVANSELLADIVLEDQQDQVVWFYRNGDVAIPKMKHRTFGAILRGEGLVLLDPVTLVTTGPVKKADVSIYPFTAQTSTPEDWVAAAAQSAKAAGAGNWEAHRAWWQAFWDRSWIFTDFPDSGHTHALAGLGQPYTLQRFVSACAGRGAYPIKFNGSIFTMDWTWRTRVNGVETNRLMNADARRWGGQYWFQNTRAMYWPMLQSGDFEMMLPLFRMYQAQMEVNARQVREYYGHDGAYLAETKPFWGGLDKIGPDDPAYYTKHYYTPILELSAMMLDYFAYTGDERFAAQTLVPMADAGLTFYDGHFKRENGKLLIEPANAIETYWKVRNPAPDIAGLRWVLRGMLALPETLTTPDQRTRWERLKKALPELPTGEKNGTAVLLPAEVFDRSRNSENPELYAIYPFRLFGLGKDQLALAQASFVNRRVKNSGCWTQDGIQAALIGDVAAALKNVTSVLFRKDLQCRFPVFWEMGNDYVPDQDNGGNGLNALQLMLLQEEGDAIRLLPAWPKDRDVHFKLHAPRNTTVECLYRGGKIESLVVTPDSRRSAIVMPVNLIKGE